MYRYIPGKVAQLVASVSGVVLGGVAKVVGSDLARGKIFTAYIGSVDSLYHIYILHVPTKMHNSKKGANSFKLHNACKGAKSLAGQYLKPK